MTEFIVGFSRASLILPGLTVIFCSDCMCNLLIDKHSALCLFSSVVCSSSVASQRREGNLCCLGTQYCYQSMVCFCVCILFFLSRFLACFSLSSFLPFTCSFFTCPSFLIALHCVFSGVRWWPKQITQTKYCIQK